MRGKGRFTAIIFTILIASAGVLSCHKENRPKGILSQGEMVKVLSEVYINEQKLGRANLRSDSAKTVFDRMQSVVLKKAGTSDTIFKKSFNYYVEHPKELELIYSALVDSLSLEEQRMDAKAANSEKPK